MTRSMPLLTAAALIAGGATAPLSAQYPYPPQYPYPQQYPGYPQQYPGYPQNQNAIGQIIDSLLGNRYNYSDRRAIRSCGVAAVQRAQTQYGNLYNQYRDDQYRGDQYRDDDQPRYDQYGQPYPRDDRYRRARTMRIVAINEVERRSGGLRVRGLIDSGLYRNRMSGAGDLTFRCDVNYNGYISRIRIDRADYRRY